MPDTDTFDDATAHRVDLARAAIASLVADQAELGLPPKEGALQAPPEGPMLVLSPSWPLGYPLTGELLALEQLSLRRPESGGSEAATPSGLSRRTWCSAG